MKKAILAALITLAVIAAATQTLITQATETECTIDPVPYEKLLTETLEKIIAQDWETAQNLIEIAKQAQICSPKIASQHEDLYNALTQLNDLLQRASIIEEKFSKGETKDLRDEISKVYSGLDYVRQVIYDQAISYYTLLSGYAQDKVSFLNYKLRIERELDALKTVVNTAMERLANIYVLLDEEASGAWIDLSVTLPRRIYAGDNVSIAVLAVLNSSDAFPSNVSEARVRVSMIIGNTLEVSREVIVKIGTNVTVDLNVPDTALMLKEGVELMRVIGYTYAALAKVVVLAESMNGELKGFTIRSTYVYAMWPPIKFYTPSYEEVNGTLTVKAVSDTITPINVSIYADDISNETFLMNTTVYPGTTWVNLSLNNVSIGYHTIIFVSEPVGRYISAQWSSAIVIGSPDVPVIINVPRVVLVPPFVVSINGELGTDLAGCDVVIYIDGVEAYRSSLSGKYFSAFLYLPIGVSTLFIGRSVITVEVVPHTAGLNPSVYVVDVIVINVLSTLVIVGITGALYLHPRTSAVFASLMRIALFKSSGSKPQKYAVINKSYKFRPFKLRKYYIILIKRLSVFVGSPSPHETLREYLKRVETYLVPKVAEVVRKLFYLFEIDLYSRNSPNVREAKDLLTVIEEELSKEVDKD